MEESSESVGEGSAGVEAEVVDLSGRAALADRILVLDEVFTVELGQLPGIEAHLD